MHAQSATFDSRSIGLASALCVAEILRAHPQTILRDTICGQHAPTVDDTSLVFMIGLQPSLGSFAPSV